MHRHQTTKLAQEVKNLKRKQTVKLVGAFRILAVACGTSLDSEVRHGNRTETAISVPPTPSIATTTLAQLTEFAASNPLTNADIASLNLICGSGLPGGDRTVRSYLATLDQWAGRVKTETERHLYRFRANPVEFENSEGYFRMLMMAVVLYEDFGVRYNLKLVSAPNGSAADYAFFANSRDVFIHGLLGSERTGTCSSMPVLYVSIGRRLGYPLKLVTTKAHVFIRWEGGGERFNLEATGKGMNRYDDEHYKQWPSPVTEEEIRADAFLKSLTPQEELALFLSIRGHCLMEARRYTEAEKTYAQAAQLAPASRGYQLFQQNAIRTAQLAGTEIP